MSITVVIPTYNAGGKFEENVENLVKQTADITEVLIIDSSSNDKTVNIAEKNGFKIEVILPRDFGHGKTRQYALEKAQNEVVVFMTQDAILADENAVKKITDFLCKDKSLAAVYGRQLPYKDTGILESFTRLYNYQENSFINTFADKAEKGIKTAFLSNSFAAYKKSLLLKVGGFPIHVGFGEDSYAAAKLLKLGYKTGYCADARVYHAHEYKIEEEFARGRKIGSFHKKAKWLLNTFGKAEGEGMRYVCSKAKYLIKNNKWYLLPRALIYDLAKFIGYKVGYYRGII